LVGHETERGSRKTGPDCIAGVRFVEIAEVYADPVDLGRAGLLSRTQCHVAGRCSVYPVLRDASARSWVWWRHHGSAV